jgi:hypothetical protein
MWRSWETGGLGFDVVTLQMDAHPNGRAAQGDTVRNGEGPRRRFAVAGLITREGEPK